MKNEKLVWPCAYLLGFETIPPPFTQHTGQKQKQKLVETPLNFVKLFFQLKCR